MYLEMRFLRNKAILAARASFARRLPFWCDASIIERTFYIRRYLS